MHVASMRDVSIASSHCDLKIYPLRVEAILNFHALDRIFVIFEGARKGDDL